MSGEIKINDEKVHKTIDNLKAAIQAFEISLSADVPGDNSLSMTNELAEMKQQFEELVAAYEALILKQANSTTEAVASFKEVDTQLASSLQPTAIY
ncbi:YwqI/YxiC family protein [Salipaludibacillus agaradhaerens]|uniref:YwqI/YxiC family protein n=1 Tax=Salipaludibacillus agaradhaerens TaxID=76935 RepID=UPI0009973F6B|nr:YwqI/YxiC family protein [Salipaludibacillus agaradhaerens]